MVDFDKRWIVWAGLIVPALFIFLKAWEKEWSIWIPIGCAAVGIWFFNENFVNKSELRQVTAPDMLGPKEPFVPPSANQWRYDMNENGEPIVRKGFEPPTNRGYPPQGYNNQR